jgi:hypothetical protein
MNNQCYIVAGTAFVQPNVLAGNRQGFNHLDIGISAFVTSP